VTDETAVDLELRIRLVLSDFVLDVDRTVPAKATGLFGPSGAGKSSLLEAVAGLRPRAVGRIRFGEHVWMDTERGLRLPAEARGVGLVPQSPLLFPHLTVRENLVFGAARVAGRQAGPALETVAELLEIGELLDRDPGDLSGGEQKRVALGRALCSAPRLLLLDEPFAGLDLNLRRKLRGLLRRIRDQLRIPMLLVSHDPADVQVLCDTTLALDRGRVISHGDPSRVLSDPKVLPLAGNSGFENVIEVEILAHEGGVTRVMAGKTGPELSVTRCQAPVGNTAVLSLRAQDVLVATQRPEGLSARNILPAVVEELAVAETAVLLRLRLGPNTVVVAELTEGARADLNLELQNTVFLVVKAQSFSVLA
jgi:molybdate transport system ATP-binding protein